jgi:hypothetical protein
MVDRLEEKCCDRDHSDDEFSYVSVINDSKIGLLLGPYDTHRQALDNVSEGKRLAVEADPKS